MKYYLIFINIFAFLCYAIDKVLAIRRKTRLSEFQLLFISLLGGSIGSLLGMIIANHKTRKRKFWLLNTLFLLLWIVYLSKNS